MLRSEQTVGGCLAITWLIFIIVYSDLPTQVSTRIEFTNIKCASMNKSFAVIGECFIKSVNRSYKYATLRLKFLQMPVSSITVRFSLLKRLSGYKPFLYNFTLDCCKFLSSPKARYPVENFFYSTIAPYTNLNHACPYNHDIMAQNLTTSHVNHQMTNILPMPQGEYAMFSDWVFNQSYRAEARLFFTIS